GGLLYTSWQFGSALGLAVVTAILVSVNGSGELSRAGMDGFNAALIVPVVAALLSAVVIAFGVRRCVRPRVGGGRAELPATKATAYE
ncbi:MAG: MFS transporter, partial [Chloroflexota bacterium]|nr:MFS transporter [Chloroflexota bacterium]